MLISRTARIRSTFFFLLLGVGSLALAPLSGQESPVVEAPVAEVTSPTDTATPADKTPDQAMPAANAAHEPSTAEHSDPENSAEEHSAGEHHDPGEMGSQLPLWTVIPFVALLLCIAILPLVAEHWWHHNSNKAIVAGALGVIVAVYMLWVWGDAGRHDLEHKVKEYVSFIILLGALYVISGGIYIRGSLSGTPLANTALIALGTLLASFIGTTGASVLLIRPLLRANKSRRAKSHIVIFFIFLVSNCGGLLTPLGDPPLFLGFLAGVPFLWTLQNLWMHWLVVNILLLVIFNVWDQVMLSREEKARAGSQLEEALVHEPVAIEGKLNFLLLAGVVATIYCSGQFGWPYGIQEVLMVVLSLAAYFTTPASNRTANQFTFGPIIEVAVLFIGIFVTMAPALQILNAWGQGNRPDLGPFALSEPWHFFWATGILSSFLDNAPTYLTLAATACGMSGVDTSSGAGGYMLAFIEKGPEAAAILAAISCGAVFMGANTYIGNGPNFMVKAIAEENGVRMPSFFGYMAYSGVVLIPVFVVVTLIFFRG
ncbi:MAG: sodium:proton antiporter [Pirellulaceae bacterium]|nr:sodium:proton antiporter [Pirellulaceae bacterium]